MFVYGRSHLSLVLEGMLKGANFYIAIKWPVCGRNYIHSSQPYLKGRSLPCSSQNKSVKARGWRPRLVPPRRRGWASWSAPAGAQEGQDTGGPATAVLSGTPSLHPMWDAENRVCPTGLQASEKPRFQRQKEGGPPGQAPSCSDRKWRPDPSFLCQTKMHPVTHLDSSQHLRCNEFGPFSGVL
jgi:hypothetical protein